MSDLENFTDPEIDVNQEGLHVFYTVTACLGALSILVVLGWILWFCCSISWRRLSGRKAGHGRTLRIDQISLILKESRLPVIDEACSICLDNIEDGLAVEVSCQHRFHKMCIKEWIKNDRFSCPLCRQLLEKV